MNRQSTIETRRNRNVTTVVSNVTPHVTRNCTRNDLRNDMIRETTRNTFNTNHYSTRKRYSKTFLGIEKRSQKRSPDRYSERSSFLIKGLQYSTRHHLDDVVVGAACGNPVHLRLHVFVDLVLVAELLRRQLTQAPPDGQLATNTGQERTARRSSADE